MKRRHWIEFEDLGWFPHFLRTAMTDYLQYTSNKFNIYKPIIPIIQKGLEKGRTQNIIDLCSGGGGGWNTIFEQLQANGQDVTICLTDMYPNTAAFKQVAAQGNGRFTYQATPVDALNVPPELQGLRTQFLSFHHFKPPEAAQILQNAVDAKATIAIFEAFDRSWLNLISVLFSPIVVFLVTPWIRPLPLTRLLFTYLIPLIPLFILWDGIASVLRSYTVVELTQMTQDLAAEQYHWEIGKLPEKGANRIVYLLGYPKS